jgi:hypothetical protein
LLGTWLSDRFPNPSETCAEQDPWLRTESWRPEAGIRVSFGTSLRWEAILGGLGFMHLDGRPQNGLKQHLVISG